MRYSFTQNPFHTVPTTLREFNEDINVCYIPLKDAYTSRAIQWAFFFCKWESIP